MAVAPRKSCLLRRRRKPYGWPLAETRPQKLVIATPPRGIKVRCHPFSQIRERELCPSNVTGWLRKCCDREGSQEYHSRNPIDFIRLLLRSRFQPAAAPQCG